MIVHWLFCIQDRYPLIKSDYWLGAGCFAKNTFHVREFLVHAWSWCGGLNK
jgi:hypothetical protein